MKKYVKDAWILSCHMIETDICKIVVQNPCPQVDIKAGQFFGIKPQSRSGKLLRRPISVCEANATSITFLIKVLGEGTEELAKLNAGEKLDIMGPLGNGFNVEADKKALVIGGGIGTAPLVQLLAELEAQGQDNIRTLLGYKERPYGLDLFAKYTNNLLTTSETMAMPHKGYATEFMYEAIKTGAYEMVYACGPEPMLECIQSVCNDLKVPVQLSIEERMACGIGACLVCTCKVHASDDAQGYDHVRCCKEGPVFYGDEVIFHD